MATNQAPLPYHALRARAEAVQHSIRSRAFNECRAAGLIDYGHLHNALVAAAHGNPWPRVDYERARLASSLFARQFIATRWLSRLYDQRGPSAFTWS